MTTYSQAPKASEPAPTAWRVRVAQLGDLGSVAEILTDSFSSGIGRWFSPVLQLGIYEDLRNRLRSPSSTRIFLVCVLPVSPHNPQEILAGTVEITLRSPFSWQHRATQYPYISNLAVAKSCRRQGVAQALLLACERTAIEWGFPDVYLHVLENNDRARRLYLKTGYQLEQIDPTWSSWLLRQPARLLLRKHLI